MRRDLGELTIGSVPERRSVSVTLRAKPLVDSEWLGCATLVVLAILAASVVISLALVDWILLAAVLLLMPLAGNLITRGPVPLAGGWLAMSALRWQPLAALGVVTSLLLPPGPLAAVLASGWLLLTIVIADAGAWSVWRGAYRRPDALAVSLGMIFVAIGGAWLVMWRVGAWPAGFEEIIAQLTAVHFHYAGLFLPLILGQVIAAAKPGRQLKAFAKVLVIAIGLSTLLLAVGITWSPAIEVVAAGLLVLAAAATGLWQAIVVIRIAAVKTELRAAASLLLISSVAMLVGLTLAATYAAGEYLEQPLLTIEQMIPLHGVAMSAGFALPGLLGWRIIAARGLAE